MLRRWALGELDSQFFGGNDNSRSEVKELLESGNPEREVEGTQKALCHRAAFINSIPADTEWYLAALPLANSEFASIKTIKDSAGWQAYTRGSYLLSDAVNYLLANPGVDQRVASIIARFPNVSLTGITMIAENPEGILTIAEGTARMVALYKHRVLDRAFVNPVEVALGLSKTKWSWS